MRVKCRSRGRVDPDPWAGTEGKLQERVFWGDGGHPRGIGVNRESSSPKSIGVRPGETASQAARGGW